VFYQEVEMTTESSVVVALREVRRLELERQRREEEARKREQDDERIRAAESAQRASIQYGPGLAPYVNGQGWGAQEGQPEAYTQPVRRTAEVVPLAAQAYAESQSVSAPPPGWLEEGVAFRPPPRQKSRFGAVLLTMIFCGGAGAAGYWKLNGEWKAAVSRLQAEKVQLEEERNDAVVARSRTEQELKVRMAELQAKLTAATTRNESLIAAQQDDGPAAAPAPPLPQNRFNRMGGRRGRMRGLPAAQKPINPTVKLAPPDDNKPSPRVAKKKPMSDDPLGGLRL
jgi:hypothetical protein